MALAIPYNIQMSWLIHFCPRDVTFVNFFVNNFSVLFKGQAQAPPKDAAAVNTYCLKKLHSYKTVCKGDSGYIT